MSYSSILTLPRPCASGFTAGLAALLVLGLSNPVFADDYGDWAYQQTINLNATPTGADIAGDAVRFPVLVRLTNNTFTFSQCQAEGQDIRFAKSDGSHFAYEIERWDSANGIAEIWVLVDTVHGDDSTALTMHWGNTSASDSSNGPAVFGTGAEFAGVWHFPTYSLTFSDATGNGLDGVNSGTVDTSGAVGRARFFDGIDDVIVLADSITHVLANAKSTFSFWIRCDTTIDGGTEWNCNSFLGDDEAGQAEDSWWGILDSGRVGVSVANDTAAMCTTRITDNLWHHVALTRDATTGFLETYLDGAREDTATRTAGPLPDHRLDTFGRNIDGSTNDGYVTGSFDEIRALAAVSSADWVRLCYQNQRQDQTLVEFGAPTILRVSSSSPDRIYRQGDTVDVSVYFSQNVSLAGGNLTVMLETGDTDRVVTITPFSASDTAAGRYIVQLGDSTPDLRAYSPLVLAQGASLHDAQDDECVLTIPGAGNLADEKDIRVDGNAPEFSSGYPKLVENLGTSVQFETLLDDTGTVYMVVVDDGAAPPTPDQVRAGRDAAGTAVGSSLSDAAATGTHASQKGRLEATGLNEKTAYDAYFAAEDTLGNLPAAAVRLDFATADMTSPVATLSYPASGSSVSDTRVSYYLSETMASGTLTWRRVAGKSDADHVQMLTGSELDSGVFGPDTIADNPALVDGAEYALHLDVEDGGSNTGADSVTSIIYDVTTPRVTAVSGIPPAGLYGIGDSISLVVRFSETVTLGEAPLKMALAGGVDDTVSITPFTRADSAVGRYIVGEDDSTSMLRADSLLTDGTLLDKAGHPAVLRIPPDSNMHAFGMIRIDGFEPGLSIAVPEEGDTIAVPSVRYVLTEDFETANMVWSRTGGAEDNNAPHTYTLGPDELSQGADTAGNALPDGHNLVPRAIYNLTFSGADSAGNEADTQIIADLYYLPDVSSISIAPDSAIVEAESTLVFIASGYDDPGRLVTQGSNIVAWQVISQETGPIGAITSGGEFYAENIGNGYVVAAYDSALFDTACIIVTGWTRNLTQGGGDTVSFGQGAQMLTPSLPSFGAGTVTAAPYNPGALPAGLIPSGRGIALASDDYDTFPQPVILELHLDTSLLPDTSYAFEDVRAYFRSSSDTSQWHVVHDAAPENGVLSFAASAFRTYAPAIDTSRPALAESSAVSSLPETTSLRVRFHIEDNIANPRVILRYRAGGSRTHCTDTLISYSADSSFVVPADCVSVRGLSYALAASDGRNESVLATRDVIIGTDRYPMPGMFSAGHYRMVSVPLDHPTGSLTDTYLDDLGGTFDNAAFRMYRTEGDGFTEVLRETDLMVRPGRAVWLRTKDSVTLDLDSARSLPVSTVYLDTVAPGWNAIASPFPFALDWSEIKDSTGADTAWLTNVYAYDHLANTWSDPALTRRMEPWEGYLIRNDTTVERVLRIPAYACPDSVPKKRLAPAARAARRVEIAIGDAASGEQSRLIAAFNAKGAADAFDRLDARVPPSLAKSFSAYFDKRHWDRHPGLYLADYRDSLGDGKEWSLAVLPRAAGRTMTMRFDGLYPLPGGVRACIVDVARSARFDLPDAAFAYYHGSPGERTFDFLIGTEGYLKSMTSRLKGIPRVFGLSPNTPNPFFRWTAIRYSIPVLNGGKDLYIRARIEVFDMRGRRVATLVDRNAEPGHHVVRWDGRTAEGRSLAPGSYVCCFTAADTYRKARRIIKMR
ncbi:MAG: DUF2341 domain-containing protein [Chitinivibrionales bacterium]|nr:DUF2341 domain-containing protein [Chitinivibrionales bacterium]MBD3394373.1 DUF2341 domain-containing protein [Chitinivibrionales bacterium]